jgi:hypothetical protein
MARHEQKNFKILHGLMPHHGPTLGKEIMNIPFLLMVNV